MHVRLLLPALLVARARIRLLLIRAYACCPASGLERACSIGRSPEVTTLLTCSTKPNKSDLAIEETVYIQQVQGLLVVHMLLYAAPACLLHTPACLLLRAPMYAYCRYAC
jgi:hypothetical protein